MNLEIEPDVPSIDMIDVLFRPCNDYKYPEPRKYDVPIIPGKTAEKIGQNSF